MRQSIIALLGAIRSSLQTRAEFEAEIVALLHQLAVLQQTAPDGFASVGSTESFGCCFHECGAGWRGAVQTVQPATVVC
jgi:hypothetical protein